MSKRRRAAWRPPLRLQRRREFWLKLGVWLFIAVFAFSVVGGLMIVSVRLTR